MRDLVVEQLDLSAILDTYDEERGDPPFHPAMMVAKGIRALRTKVEIDEALLRDALRITGLKTNREVLESGLRTLVRIGIQADLRAFRGKRRWEGDLEAMREGKGPW